MISCFNLKIPLYRDVFTWHIFHSFLSRTQIIIIHLKWIAHKYVMQVFFEPTYRSRERKLVNELSIWKTLALPGPSVVYRSSGRVFGTGTILLIEGVGYNGPRSAEYFQPIGSAAFLRVWSASSFLQQLLLPGFTACYNLSFPFLVFESLASPFLSYYLWNLFFPPSSSLNSSARLILTWCCACLLPGSPSRVQNSFLTVFLHCAFGLLNDVFNKWCMRTSDLLL